MFSDSEFLKLTYTFSVVHLDIKVKIFIDALASLVDLYLSTSEFKQEETCTAKDHTCSSQWMVKYEDLERLNIPDLTLSLREICSAH